MVCLSLPVFVCGQQNSNCPSVQLELPFNNGLLMVLAQQEEGTRTPQSISLWLHCVMR